MLHGHGSISILLKMLYLGRLHRQKVRFHGNSQPVGMATRVRITVLIISVIPWYLPFYAKKRQHLNVEHLLDGTFGGRFHLKSNFSLKHGPSKLTDTLKCIVSFLRLWCDFLLIYL